MGCLHNRINWDPKSKEGVAQWMKFVEEAADLVISYGGSLSGEHGDGQARGALLPKMYGPKIMQGIRGVQNDMGSRLEDESGKAYSSIPHR